MWDYMEAGQLITPESVRGTSCIYCHEALVGLPARAFEAGLKRLFVKVSLCPVCGWWTVFRVHQGEHPRCPGIEGYSGSIGCLKELDLTDVTVPLHEVRQQLLARKDSLFETHPKLLEEVVCSVFKDLGWNARVTAFSGDDGIDVILDGPAGDTVGVQVKRYQKERRIEAEQIRSLAGALLLNGYTRGIFVTTSEFRRGAASAARKLSAIGYPIELVNADRFLGALGIAQRRSFKLEGEQIASYIMSQNVHLGSSLQKAFTPGEDLTEREILAQTWLAQDLIDLRSN